MLKIGSNNSKELGLKINFFCSDIRNIPLKTEFDLVMNLFTSFGYFDTDEENYSFIKRTKNLLLLNGYFAFDYLNKNELIENLIPETKKSQNGKTYLEKKSEVESQAVYLTEHLEKTNSFGSNFQNQESNILVSVINEIASNIMQSADKHWGGFSRAPKFPQTFSIRFLMRYAVEIKEMIDCKDNPDHPGAEFLKQALLTIDKMINGGIYDHLGGGFARYSTDSEWLVPHFEKMLYDNALLISVISEAYQLTRDERYKEVIRESIGFVSRELMDEKGGFYSAIDADSEGVEGKFYVWNYSDVIEVLESDGKLFCAFYDIKPEGNWHESDGEKKNIL